VTMPAMLPNMLNTPPDNPASFFGATGSFDWALVFVGAHCLLTIFAFLVIVGPIRRLELPA
jgi:hypothetical protein